MDEVLDEEQIGPPRRVANGLGYWHADEPVGLAVADGKREYVDRPDAQRAASVEVAEVMRLATRFEQDGCDQKSRKYEEEIDAGPAPLCWAICECACETRPRVIEDDCENRDA